MKNIITAITLLFLVAVMSTSCNHISSPPAIISTAIMETALANVWTEVAETQAAIPTATLTALPLPQATPYPPTETPIPTSALLFSGTPTVIPMDNGITWSECVVPNEDYANVTSDMEFLESCIETPKWSESDKKMIGERVEGQNSFTDLRITIGSDNFETEIADVSEGCCHYQLIKNGEAILEMAPGFGASDPNRYFWNIEGKLVWELAGWTQVIVVDGVDYNQKYQLEGSYFPYKIRGKLIYIAKKNGTYHIVYDNNVVGPEFDGIQMAYCCAMASVYRGSGQYWFLGRRGGTKYVVSIQ